MPPRIVNLVADSTRAGRPRTRVCTGDSIVVYYRFAHQRKLCSFHSSPGESPSTSAPTMPSTQTPPAKLNPAFCKARGPQYRALPTMMKDTIVRVDRAANLRYARYCRSSTTMHTTVANLDLTTLTTVLQEHQLEETAIGYPVITLASRVVVAKPSCCRRGISCKVIEGDGSTIFQGDHGIVHDHQRHDYPRRPSSTECLTAIDGMT